MKNFRKDVFRLGWLDFSLSALASCLAVFSVGMGLRQVDVAWFLIAFIVVGTFISFLITRVLPERLAWISGMVYSVVAILCVIYVQPLNAMLPMGGFPAQLVIAAALAWMIAIGSFLTWRDSTIVFQAVPCIALFGLVGAWDTYDAAPFAFFGFLLCFATLFARAHGRIMMVQAQESGYTPAGGTSILAAAADVAASLYESLKQGPWRWMAGPEWALGSAAVIILLSVLGAPVFQSSVQGVAGLVRLNVPQATPTLTPASNPFTASASGNVNVGQGPRNNLQKKPVFTIATSDQRPRYLRQRTYDEYTGRGWRQVDEFASRAVMSAAIQDLTSFMNRSRLQIEPYEKVGFEVRFIEGFQEFVPIPGDIEFLNDSFNFMRLQDGGIRLAQQGNRTDRVSGVVRVPPFGAPAGAVVRGDMERYAREGGNRATDRVRALTLEVIANATTDYDKVQAIKQAVASRITYDLTAAGVPSGSDPVDWALFEGRKGYCDLFATSVVVMSRIAGLPARYVTGYYPALGIKDKQKRWVLHQSEAHAWAEVYFEGQGWVPVDATEGAQGVGTPNAEESLLEKEWVRVGLILLGGLAIVMTPVTVNYIVRKRRPVKDPLRSAVGKHYAVFVSAMEHRSGKPKRPSQTPTEYLETIAEHLGDEVSDARTLNDQYVAALYSAEHVPAESLAALQSSTQDLRRRLRHRR